MHAHGEDIDSRLKRRLFWAIVLTAAIFGVELAGGIFSGSLALISDSMHVLMDAVALGLSFFAIYISALPPTDTRTYGYHRAEVFAALINGITVALVSLFIFYKAYGRFVNPVEVHSAWMLGVAIVGLVVNLSVAYWLHSFAKTDLNVKSAFLHVLGDAAASIGVIVGAVAIKFTGIMMIDSLVSVFIGAIILFGAVRIIVDSAHILLEGVPRDIELKDVISKMTSVKGVTGVHSLHVWSICHNVNALSTHIEIADFSVVDRRLVLKEINEKLAESFHIFYTTIQVECTECKDSGVLRRLVHRERD